MKTPFTVVAYWSWAVLLAVWLPGYLTVKKTSHAPSLGFQIPTSVLLLVCFVLLFNPRGFGLQAQLTPQTEIFGWIGVAIDLLGIAFAIWARIVLGRNWSGLIMGVKEGHELVQKGPYAIVRHPIYTGFLLAIFGTTLTLGTFASYVGFVAGAIALVTRIGLEERLMREQFGDSHDAYRRRTKKLIPFVW
jgi:protein-S-isoprenylcysteine O-methyltransferase Ste14